jgi:glycosyltransferase involved in cell wall biosynthesis
MKIAAVSTSTVPSLTANSIQVMKACSALVKAGHEIQLWVPGSHPEGELDLAAHYGLDTLFEIHWIPSVPGLKRYDFAWKSFQEARRGNCVMVYTWLLQSAVLGLFSGMPTILELHDLPTGRMGPFLFRLFTRLKGKKRLLLITDALRKKLEKQYSLQLSSPETTIAPNGTDPARYTALPDPIQARRELGINEGPTAVYTGHFYAGRGMDMMFELAKKLPQIRFLWVGGNPHNVSLWQERLKAAGINNVTITGFVENIRLPLYQAAGEVLLMPFESRISGSSGGNSAEICSPMKMFDYLASGRAILASDLPVLGEVLNKYNAVFCPIDDVSAWAEALDQLIKDQPRRTKLGAQAKLDSVAYSWLSRAQKAIKGF